VLGDATLLGDLAFTGGLTIAGAVRGFTWNAADLMVDGNLRIEGSLADGGEPVSVTVMSDLENLGSMTNSRVVMAGEVDQRVGTGSGIAVPEFVIASGLSADSYQWYRDGLPLLGEVHANLTLDTVTATDDGRYHCEAGHQMSRQVIIAESLDVTDAPLAFQANLEQNFPNPFNPATSLAFTLDRAGPVSLVVYDLKGREVDHLVASDMAAGRHLVTWEPRNLASGTYVYRLTGPGVEFSRKCNLLK